MTVRKLIQKLLLHPLDAKVMVASGMYAHDLEGDQVQSVGDVVVVGVSRDEILSKDEVDDTLSDTHRGFVITCDRCGSRNVGVYSNVGYSEVSGGWGEVGLLCKSCGADTEIWEPYG